MYIGKLLLLHLIYSQICIKLTLTVSVTHILFEPCVDDIIINFFSTFLACQNAE
jgi:hypothetical protein